MGFTSVLKKIGIEIAKGAEVSAEVLQMPFVAQIINGGLNLLPAKEKALAQTVLGDISTFDAIAGNIATAEVMIQGPGTGSQKLQAVRPFIQQEVQAWANSQLPGHSKLKVDAPTFAADCDALTSAMVKLLNDFGD